MSRLWIHLLLLLGFCNTVRAAEIAVLDFDSFGMTHDDATLISQGFRDAFLEEGRFFPLEGYDISDRLGSGREASEDGEPRTCVKVFDQLPVAGFPVIVARQVGEAGRLLGNGEQFVGIQGNQAVGITDSVAEQIESAHPIGVGEIGCGLPRLLIHRSHGSTRTSLRPKLATPLLTGPA